MDKIDPIRRSENMRRIKNKNTKPELLVRKLVCSLGYKGYRIHRRDIPGMPDIAWPSRKIAIFVHGCFWHKHHCKEGQRRPKTRIEYWEEKIDKNRARDLNHNEILTSQGWNVLVIWECELKDNKKLEKEVESFLSSIY